MDTSCGRGVDGKRCAESSAYLQHKEAKRTLTGHWDRIGKLIDLIKPQGGTKLLLIVRIPYNTSGNRSKTWWLTKHAWLIREDAVGHDYIVDRI